jgi:hypothetical protein
MREMEGRELLAAAVDCDLVIRRDIDGSEEVVGTVGSVGDELSDGYCSMLAIGGSGEQG